MAYPLNPHFSFPFRFVRGRAVVVDQDSQDEIVQNVERILSFTLGDRVELPEFGVPDQTFREREADLGAIGNAIDRWEPRAEYALTQDLIDETTARVRVGFGGQSG